ncbi:piggyBac transposable element-derived protein 4-like [Rana temporaria]|uniref:piggyBac transposable element-derived protein 4-like n=1 Tax=Rana temporaria TaxID=8407 RepID=UPI001AAD935A|nr:piggyBac transposable element-derived protein 4-like [Rana temporaria]XP_040203621.1 piggyBac transposable element-derived protein 4-like [Rana temporaria]
MASKRHFSTSKAALDQISDSDSDTEFLAELSDSDSDSWQDSSYDSDSDQRSSDSDESPLELSEVRTWCPIDCGMDAVPPPRFPFTGSPGMKVEVDYNDPLAYLKLFLTDDVIEKIVTETNRYKEQQSTTLHSKFSRSRKWEPVSKEDIWKFLGLILLQGVVGKPLQRWYWTKNKLLATPFFGTIMSEYRFSLIMKNLHFTNNEDFDEATHPAPKLKKIWEVFQMIITNFQQAYVPDRDISIDESLMAYKGRLSWIQYIASKRARFGIKSYMLCESTTGYIWNSIIYTGKGTQFNPRYSDYGMATSSVLSLLEPLLNQGYCVTTDNFYTSPELYEFLLKNKTDAYGTARANRRDLPCMFSKKKLKTGEMVAWQKGKMMAMRWRDKKDVCLMSTVHTTSTAMVHTRGGKDVKKPQLVIDYNNTMGGVDRADQAMTFYPAMRKQQKKYYKKIFRHLLEQCMWNAYILHKGRSDKPLVHSDFIWKVVEQIFLNYQTPSVAVNRSGRRAVDIVNPERLTGRHFTDYIPPSAKKAAPTRMCVVCCSKRDGNGKKVRKETRFYCSDCDVGLCAVPCFKIYHTQDVY